MADALPEEARTLCDALRRRTADIEGVQISRLGECRSAAELAEWESELHASFARVVALVRQLRDEVEEADSAAERSAVAAEVQEQQQRLDELRGKARQALLTAHRAVQAQSERAARESLNLGAQGAPRRRAASDDRATTASEEVTNALQRTVALMSAELDKSGYSAQLLEESSGTISAVSESYASFGDLLRNSIALIRSMERAELWDLGILLASMAFFAGCIMYILYVRVLTRGVWVAGALWKYTGVRQVLQAAMRPVASTSAPGTASASESVTSVTASSASPLSSASTSVQVASVGAAAQLTSAAASIATAAAAAVHNRAASAIQGTTSLTSAKTTSVPQSSVANSTPHASATVEASADPHARGRGSLRRGDKGAEAAEAVASEAAAAEATPDPPPEEASHTTRVTRSAYTPSSRMSVTPASEHRRRPIKFGKGTGHSADLGDRDTGGRSTSGSAPPSRAAKIPSSEASRAASTTSTVSTIGTAAQAGTTSAPASTAASVSTTAASSSASTSSASPPPIKVPRPEEVRIREHTTTLPAEEDAMIDNLFEHDEL